MPELTISPEKSGFLIEKAREFDVKEAATDLDSGSNGTDDNMIDVLEDDGSDSDQNAISFWTQVFRHFASLVRSTLLSLSVTNNSANDVCECIDALCAFAEKAYRF